MPKLVAISGYYNREDVVERTIRSIQRQTYKDFEFVVFDDASTDSTADKIKQSCECLSNPPIAIRPHESNIGFTQGMINAIDATDSEYIAIQGSGDVSHPDRFEAQTKFLDMNPRVVAVGSWYRSIVEGESGGRIRRPRGETVNLSHLLKRNTFTHGEVMFRRRSYVQAGGYRAAFTFCQDYDLWLRMLRLGTLGTVPKVLYDRYIRSDGVSYSPQKFLLQSRFAIAARELALIGDADQQRSHYERLANEGIDCLVTVDHPALQPAIVRATLSYIAWGKFAEASELKAYISKPRSAALLANTLLAACRQLPVLGRAIRVLGDSNLGR